VSSIGIVDDTVFQWWILFKTSEPRKRMLPTTNKTKLQQHASFWISISHTSHTVLLRRVQVSNFAAGAINRSRGEPGSHPCIRRVLVKFSFRISNFTSQKKEKMRRGLATTPAQLWCDSLLIGPNISVENGNYATW
jgi:hypothetical protein